MIASYTRDTAIDIFNAALRAVDPHTSAKNHMPLVLSACKDRPTSKIFLISFGKAAVPMATAAIEGLGADVPIEGIVLTKYGHSAGAVLPENIELYEAGHPIPDEAGHHAANRVLNLVDGADESTLVLFLISGGGSALLVAPCEGVLLEEKQKVTDMLLRSGASIGELNTVRKHLSQVKGGRLARAAYPARGLSLILSDVIRDSLDVIASGPTCADPSTYEDALHILERYGLTESAPAGVMEALRRGADGDVPETPKQGDPLLAGFENIIIGSNEKAAGAARNRAVELGYNAAVMSTVVQGEAREVARRYAESAMDLRKTLLSKGAQRMCLVFGGETTVTVKGEGTGGRNTEFALAFAKVIEGVEGVTLLSAGTDGTDGPTDAAGAVVDGGTIERARAKGLDPQSYLDRNDSYNFFRETGELLITGPTGTNVMDLQIILIDNK